MRQALGLRGDAPGERPPQRREQDRRVRRFVRDGEVPVVVLNTSRDHGPDGPPPVNRIAAAENALRSERGARERAERSLKEAMATSQHIQTKLAHADLAHNEALAAERAGRERAEAALAEAIAARDSLEQRLAEMTQAQLRVSAATPGIGDGGDTPTKAAPTKPRRKAAVRPEREPEPVKWWLPSYKARTRKS